MNDLKFAFRQLLKSPGFTAVAVLTLVLGIGANTAMFSFVNAILLQPLPYKDADRLVLIFENYPANGWFRNAVAAPLLEVWRKQSTLFEGLGARGYSGAGLSLTGLGPPTVLHGWRVSANVFRLLGVKPILGRDFVPEEETFGRHHVVLLSHELWQNHFGGDTNILGRSITLDSELKTVVGIMPPRTDFPQGGVQIWLPLAFEPWELRYRHAHNYLVLGKLKPGGSIAQADAEMDLIARGMAAIDAENKGWGVEVHRLQESMVGDVRPALLVLLGAVALVLLIGCANIANLLLARSTTRVREFAIRAALGAGRARLVRQLLVESLLLAAIGGVGGWLLAAAGLASLIHLSPPDLPRAWEGIHLDGTTLLFTTGLTLMTGLLFGLLPAWQTSKPALASELTETATGIVGVRHARLRSSLVVSEVALSIILLVGAGLMIRSFGRLLSQNFGFNAEQVVTMDINLPGRKYPDQSARQAMFDQLLARVRAIPAVRAAGGVFGLPLSGSIEGQDIQLTGATPLKPGELLTIDYAQVSPGYFSAMGIPFLLGRDFTETDTTNSPMVLIVSAAFVRQFNLGTNILGRRLKVTDSSAESEIIGMVQDVKGQNLATSPRGAVYRSYRQVCRGRMTLVIRTERPLAGMARAVRVELDPLDKDVPLENVRTMRQLLESSVAQRKLSVRLLTAFGGAALFLAAMGLYGVLAYVVAQRRREIGMRMALGAQRRDVLKLIVGQGMRLTTFGIIAGLTGALALTRLLQSLLYEVKPGDPLTFAAVTLLLWLAALLACYLPARRASRVDPMEALRCE